MSTSYVHIIKGAAEPTANALRRFTKKVQESGIIPKKRGQRYAVRTLSPLKQKRAKLTKLEKGRTYDRLKKLGKLVVKKKKGGR
jgi:ribosomal protein S21